MRLSTITLTNFRCFGPTAQQISLDDMTALVGTNACGKTTVLHALQRLFGATSAERELRPDDFHVPRFAPTDGEPVVERSLAIDVRLEFPELEDPDADEEAVAECFRHMAVSKEGETPYCVVRLEGDWSAKGAPEGIVEQHTYWVRPSPDADDEEVKSEMRAADRARIHLHYVPAARDPLKQVRHVSGSIMARLFKAVNWSDTVKQEVADSSAAIQTSFSSEGGVKSIQSALSKNWKALHDTGLYGGVKIRPVSNRFDDLLRQVEAVFAPSPGGTDDPLDRLSDGQRSLFYLAMVGAAFDIETEVLAAVGESESFDVDRLVCPALTIFAVEEPENHIAPHYLGGIMTVLRGLSTSGRAQVVLTSHSPSILHRVEPEEVRHLRLDSTHQTSLVREVLLPKETDDAHKFIREAVRAYPELYFARFVVLGEGDSEEIVLPRISEAFGVPIDHSFVSIVPLGGRHVNHMWRLLRALDIPHATLLDFDRERKGGAWGRIKYAVTQLLKVGVPQRDLLTVDGGEVLSDGAMKEMHTWKVDEVDPQPWLRDLEMFGVYFSAPLDLDFLMLRHFPDAYHGAGASEAGPSIPDSGDDDYDEEVSSVIRAVLKEAGGDGSSYDDEERGEFFWYRYLFLSRGKPTTHLKAMVALTEESLKSDCPSVLKRLVSGMKTELRRAIAGAPHAA